MGITHRNLVYAVAMCNSQQKRTTAIIIGNYTSQPRLRICDVYFTTKTNDSHKS